LVAVETITNITAQKQHDIECQRLKELLEYQSRIDPLTDVFNRRGWSTLAAGYVKRYQAERAGIGVLILDLDHFRTINDQLGHTAGDEALRRLASILKATARPQDLIGRWGDEEFVILIEGTASELAAVAERLRFTVAETPLYAQEGIRLGVTVSIGGAMIDSGPDGLTQALQRAESRLVMVKAAGRNRSCVVEDVKPSVPRE
jgi:diguanylate cyclase (GGDEF)-like protein